MVLLILVHLLYPPPYSDWVLNQGYEIVGNDIKYTAYKTNSLNYYDSFALADLVQTLVKSFHDPDLQQYAAFTSAIEQLTGTSDWVLDPANTRVIYYEYGEGSFTATVDVHIGYGSSKTAACESIRTKIGGYFTLTSVNSTRTEQSNFCFYNATTGDVLQYGTVVGEIGEKEEKYLPFPVVAEKVISNAESGEDEVLKLLSEDYINLVAESIFNTDKAKQFVKLEDLIPQLETNKVLRS